MGKGRDQQRRPISSASLHQAGFSIDEPLIRLLEVSRVQLIYWAYGPVQRWSSMPWSIIFLPSWIFLPCRQQRHSQLRVTDVCVELEPKPEFTDIWKLVGPVISEELCWIRPSIPGFCSWIRPSSPDSKGVHLVQVPLSHRTTPNNKRPSSWCHHLAFRGSLYIKSWGCTCPSWLVSCDGPFLQKFIQSPSKRI